MKQKFLSLLLSAAMLLTLLPAFGTGASAEEEIQYLEPEYAKNAEGGSTGGSAVHYETDDDGVATVESPAQLRHAMEDAAVSAVVLAGNEDGDYVELGEDADEREELSFSKPLIINEGAELRIGNAEVTATADITVYGYLTLFGGSEYSAVLRLSAPGEYWEKQEGSVPELTNKGSMALYNRADILLTCPCLYTESEDAELSMDPYSTFVYVDYLTETEDCCYTDEQATVKTALYDDEGEVSGETVLHAAAADTAAGLKRALADERYYAGIQVLGEGVTLSKSGEEDEYYAACCALTAFAPLTVGEGVTLSLADADNVFHSGLTVEAGGKLLTEESIGEHSTLVKHALTVAGTLQSFGRLETCCDAVIAEGGTLEVMGSSEPITYEYDWTDAKSHVFFNNGNLTVEAGGTLSVAGGMQNGAGASLTVCGAMNVLAPAAGIDNTAKGVINGAVKSWERVYIDGGTLSVAGAQQGSFPAAFVCLNSSIEIINGGTVHCGGSLYSYQYSSLTVDGDSAFSLSGNMESEESYLGVNGGTFDIGQGATLEQAGGNIDLGGGELTVSGKLHGDGDSVLLLNSGCLTVTDGGTLYSEGEIDIQGSSELLIQEGGTLQNDGTVENLYSGTLTVSGTLINNGELNNYGEAENNGGFTVYETAALSNGGYLRVGDSATWGGDGFAEINWQIGGKEISEILTEDAAFRLWRDCGGESYELNEDFRGVKCAEKGNYVVRRGQDYFGNWENREDASVTSGNEGFVSVRDEGSGRFTLCYNDWGDTVLEVTAEDDIVRTYHASTCLNALGFYCDCPLIENQASYNYKWLDEDAAMDCAVLGDCYCYDLGDSLYLMREGEGFYYNELGELDDEDELLLHSYALHLTLRFDDGREETATLGEREEDGGYSVRCGDTEYLRLYPVPRNNTWNNRYDLRVVFTGGEESYELLGEINDDSFSLRCAKPTVYVEDTPAVKGGTVCVAVRGENLPQLLGYQLGLCYDTEKLTATGITVSGEYQYISEIDEENGTVRVAAPATEQSLMSTEDALFTVTFTVADSDAVDACEDIAVRFDEDFEQVTTVSDGEGEKAISTAFCGGSVQTFLPGDVHRDGKVNILDAVRLLRASAQLVELEGAEYAAALVNGQSTPSVLGVLSVLKHIVRGEALYCSEA